MCKLGPFKFLLSQNVYVLCWDPSGKTDVPQNLRQKFSSSSNLPERQEFCDDSETCRVNQRILKAGYGSSSSSRMLEAEPLFTKVAFRIPYQYFASLRRRPMTTHKVGNTVRILPKIRQALVAPSFTQRKLCSHRRSSPGFQRMFILGPSARFCRMSYQVTWLLINSRQSRRHRVILSPGDASIHAASAASRYYWHCHIMGPLQLQLSQLLYFYTHNSGKSVMQTPLKVRRYDPSL